MPSPARLPERLRRPPRPVVGQLPLRALRHHGAPPAALPARDHGARVDVAHPDRLAHRAGPAGRGARSGRRPATRLPPCARRVGCRRHPAAHGHLHRGPRRGGGERGPGLRVRGPDRDVGLRRGRLRDHDGSPARRRSCADIDLEHPSRLRRRPLLRANVVGKGRDGLRLAVVVGRPADEPGRGDGPTRLHHQLLAGLAVRRHLSRPPVAQLPGAQRPDAQGPELRPHRRHHGGGDDLAARDARRGAQLGLPLHLDPRLVLHVALALPARIRLGGARVLRLRPRSSWRGGSGDFSTCRSCTASTAGRT